MSGRALARQPIIVDKDGKIRHALYDIKSKGHVAQILELVREL